jgi:hypothetical protein
MHSVGQLIYAVWTNNGANEAGLADAMFDGRIDALCRYITGDDTDDRDCGVGFVNHDGSATAVVTTVPSSKDASDASIDHVHCKDLSYETFCDAYMLQNRPLIIDGLTDAWDCRLRWVRPKDGKPDMKYISDTFGSCRAPVFEQASQGFSLSRPVSTEMTVGDYCKWWEHQQSQPLPNNTNDKGNDRLLYLKDWKFVADVPHHTEVYTCPHFFQDDWLNQAMQSGYKYVRLQSTVSLFWHTDCKRACAECSALESMHL